MAKRINFGDNIFIIHDMITTLQKAISLELDSPTFHEKIIDDILFVDNGLGIIFEALKNNPMLIIRDEHLRQILRAKQDFVVLIDKILHPDYSGSIDFKPAHHKLSSCLKDQQSEIDQIRIMIQDEKMEHGHEDQISSTELQFLLGDSEE